MVKEMRMGCAVWMLVLTMLFASGSEVRAQCWENAGCQDITSDRNILECIKMCRSELTAESPIYPGDGHLQPVFLVPNDIPAATLSTPPEYGAPESGPQHEDKRSYSMEHFRWGKPVGRKRRPIKVYANGVEEESAEALPAEMKRESGGVEDSTISQDKKDGTYKMNHFRWGGPPASKRYGGFMKSWDERSQKPLLTLFKNIINKDGHQKKD
ncbi:pro-opiomelanocortin precursor, partial [Silurus asotus]